MNAKENCRTKIRCKDPRPLAAQLHAPAELHTRHDASKFYAVRSIEYWFVADRKNATHSLRVGESLRRDHQAFVKLRTDYQSFLGAKVAPGTRVLV
jgi:hypothetical protein